MLEVCGLTKDYDGLLAVDEVSFQLMPGDVLGFIGSNGAGKTTTIRMLATLLEPTEGTARLNGADIMRDPVEVRRQIGYMPDFFGLYDDVKVWEYLDFFATIYRVPKKQRSKIVEEVLDLTNLTVKHDAFVQSLSRGMQQRLCLARCLVHDPTLLLLDEPASGLDPRARAELKELIAKLGRMGKIVIVSSHILPELAGFCNTVGIIERGRLLACGPVKEIIRDFQSSRTIRIRVLNRAAAVAEFAAGFPGVVFPAVRGKEIMLEYQGDHESQAELLGEMIRAGFQITDFTEDVLDLEDVFLRLTTGAVN